MAGRRRRRRSIGCYRVCQYLCAVFACVSALFLGRFGLQVFDKHYHPFRNEYLTFDIPESAAVKPLFTNRTVFDVEATLWLNITGYLQHNPDLGQQWQHLKVETYVRADRNITEAAVFNDIVLRDLKIDSKEFTSVKVRLPSAPFFQDPALGPHLRSTFVLVPRSGVDVPPGATFNASYSALPLPLIDNKPRPGMVMSAETGVGITTTTKIPDLSSLYGVANAQGQNFFYKRRRELHWPKKRPVKNESLPVIFLNHTDRPETQLVDPQSQSLIDNTDSSIWHKNGTTYISRNARYISTRNRIAIGERSPIFMRSLYLMRHAILAGRLVICIHQAAGRAFPSCDPAKVKMDRDGGAFDQLLFSNYAEFNDPDSHEAAPEGLITRYLPALVTLETSQLWKYRLELPDFGTDQALEMQKAGVIEYDWELYFSPLSFATRFFDKVGAQNYQVIQDRFPIMRQGQVVNQEKNITHEDMAYHLAFKGDRTHPDSKPWRNLIATSSSAFIQLICAICLIAYWVGCSTSAGISIAATLTSVTSSLFEMGYDVANNTFGGWLVPNCLTFAYIYFQLRVALRLKVVGWRLQRMKPSHRERASSRLDAMPLWMSLGLPAALSILYMTGVPDTLVVRPALGHAPEPEIGRWIFLLRIYSALEIAAGIRQIWFNHKCRTYAGVSRIASILLLFDAVVNHTLLQNVYAISGHLEIRPKLTLADVFRAAMLSIQGCQALILPPVDQNVEDKDDE
ncbi:hypothetical protein OC861_003906 [Tilletia horrida]|nr:hypothetical protein OC861_003906 [Tilletia horrida]